MRNGKVFERAWIVGGKMSKDNILPIGWEKRKLGNLLLKIEGGGTPSRDVPEYYNGKIPWATVKDLSDDNFKSDTIEHISEEGLKNSSAKIVDKGNFIISTRMGLGRGFINEVDMAINQDLKGLYPDKKVLDVIYLMYWYKSISKKLELLGSGSTVKGIDLKLLKSLELYLMPIEEQRKIASILLTWDKAIELKEKLIEQKKEQKKGLMQKLLTGEIRLPGFGGEWKEIYLRDCIIEYKEKTTIPNQFPILTSSRNGLMLQSEYYSNRQVTTDDNVGYNIVPRNYITYRSRSDDNKFVFNKNTIIDFGIVSNFYPVFKFNDRVCTDFILELLNNTIERKAKSFIEGTAQKVLSLKKLGNFKYTVPSLEEQEAISKRLNVASKGINLLEKEVESLKQQKKGLMQLLLTGKVRVKV